jgi:leucyl-tRNA synthetase
MGHVRVYTISDAQSRFHRMNGSDVVHPMGWDAFGLPAENAALQRNVSASEWTKRNINQMKDQLDSLNFRFDWDLTLRTCDPSYYRWTQWLFLQLYNHGLARRTLATVNWDPVDRTVLANEQVDAEGKSWRSGAVVEKRELPQWFFRITEYADDLLDGLKDLPGWPETVKRMQYNWIGASDGVRVRWKIKESEEEKELTTFTTRVETLYGVTFLVLSHDHPLCRRSNHSHVKEDEDMCLPFQVVHPLTGESIPVFASSYVLSDYGDGAVMGT